MARLTPNPLPSQKYLPLKVYLMIALYQSSLNCLVPSSWELPELVKMLMMLSHH